MFCVDGRVLEPFDKLRQQDAKLDEGLADISDGVKKLRAVAIDIGDVRENDRTFFF